MPDIVDAAKRLLVGRPVRSDRLGHALLRKREAMPIFASDALSSVAYAPDEILLTLSLAGLAAATISPWVGLAVVGVMLTVVASYRHLVRAYPDGRGDYHVTTVNLGKRAGLAVGSAVLVDYVLTVAVSLSSSAQYLATLWPALRGNEEWVATGMVALVALANVRGRLRSRLGFAVPVYLFLAAMGVMAVVGGIQWAAGSIGRATSADYEVVPLDGLDQGLMGIAGAFLVLRAFSSGAVALTGVEAISTGVPAFRRPKARNAALTLAMLGLIGATMLMSVLGLARATGVRFVEDPSRDLRLDGVAPGDDFVQTPVIGQIAEVVFASVPWLFFVVVGATALILVLAANTAFNGFPQLASVLGKDGFLPRQLHTRGDRLALTNGIVSLAVAAIALIWIFEAQITQLIQLYIVGVFVSFTLSQLGMVRHWNRLLRTVIAAQERAQMVRARAVNAFGFALTAVVLAVVVVTKATHGAWIAVGLMALLYVLMGLIRRHYDAAAEELALDDEGKAKALPSRVHAVVLVSQVHKPTMRALAYARATRPSTLQAISVAVDAEETSALRASWDRLGLPLPLTVLDSPYREVTRPVLEFVKAIRRESPRDLVVVYVPEYVVGSWWERLLHNRSSARLKARLLHMPGVVMASVPWQLRSAQLVGPAAGGTVHDVRTDGDTEAE
ncbi:APC family permease [Ruania halotolerans]|uniref:APC family permease n=1 Tax=Ruania halotolerans TaxID=2897773 RepID=UPI001E44112E|nr:APC family permease [Ruania halotolerans]UFU04799.1 APC family permease [Ruania halotolerans]